MAKQASRVCIDNLFDSSCTPTSRSAVPLSYVTVSVDSSTGGSGTLVSSNVAFTQPDSASAFVDTVNNNPGVIFTSSTDTRLQVIIFFFCSWTSRQVSCVNPRVSAGGLVIGIQIGQSWPQQDFVTAIFLLKAILTEFICKIF